MHKFTEEKDEKKVKIKLLKYTLLRFLNKISQMEINTDGISFILSTIRLCYQCCEFKEM